MGDINSQGRRVIAKIYRIYHYYKYNLLKRDYSKNLNKNLYNYGYY